MSESRHFRVPCSFYLILEAESPKEAEEKVTVKFNEIMSCVTEKDLILDSFQMDECVDESWGASYGDLSVGEKPK